MNDDVVFDEAEWNKLPYLTASWKFEDECEATTDARLPKLGKVAPQTMGAIGRMLSYLDAISSCGWGCPGGDHALEQTLFRATNRARAAIRLLRFGFYDESLALSRTNGEIANLLMLFTLDPTAIGDWKNQEKWMRRPVEVRKAIEKLGMMVPIDEDRYRLLSGIAAHAAPEHRPGAHNILGQPAAGGYFQPEGALLCLNEISFPLMFVAVATSKLITIPAAVKTALLAAATHLLNNTGGFDIQSQDKYWKAERNGLAKAITDAENKTVQ